MEPGPFLSCDGANVMRLFFPQSQEESPPSSSKSDASPADGSLGSQCLHEGPLTQSCRPICGSGGCEVAAFSAADCWVLDVFDRGTVDEREESIQRCPTQLFDPTAGACGAHCPCWRLLYDELACTADLEVAPLRLDIMRQEVPGPGRLAVVGCSVPHDWRSLALAATAPLATPSSARRRRDKSPCR